MSDPIITTIYGCARCGGQHSQMSLLKLQFPIDAGLNPGDMTFTHWCPCPITGEPIIMRIVGGVGLMQSPSFAQVIRPAEWKSAEHNMPADELAILLAGSRQPAPSGTGPEITPLVIKDLEARYQYGKDKYGEGLRANNGRDPLIDLYQELMDAVLYTRQALEEKYGPQIEG